ncbi:hypothetical protein H4219_005901 [Mycoemilia scoparia]|uniref:Peptidase S1 domain-containing protein n=1 Tax=Mycoemilia scoparia TaxID=417184 RepID=A0A9W7ZM47_9FUNG|nr:hypothetical protein H4219_005901 [Mycoemilia scoparia]
MLPIAVIAVSLLCLAAVTSNAAGIQQQAEELKKRIVNGSGVGQHQYPFAVRLTTTFNPGSGVFIVCGGTIIAKNAVLTAAHCVQAGESSTPVSPSQINVGAGSSNVGELEQFRVRQVFRHPNYKAQSNQLQGDIAILILEEELPFSDKINSINLASGPANWGVTYQALGYGKTSDGGPLSQQLLSASFRLYSNPVDYCDFFFPGYGSPSSSVVCFEYDEGSSDFCNGDSGGALVAQGSSGLEIYGISSFGVTRRSNRRRDLGGPLYERNLDNNRLCGNKNTIDIFTAVYSYRDYINQSIRSAGPSKPYSGGNNNNNNQGDNNQGDNNNNNNQGQNPDAPHTCACQ